MTMHTGHRGRMRERFRQESLDGFAAHEVLELLLFYAKPRGDVNPLAHRLLDTFGGLQGVLEAGTEQLCQVDGVGLETATLLSMMLPLFRRYSLACCGLKPILSNTAEIREYCTALLRGLRNERLYVLCVSPSMSLVGQRMIAEGSLNEVEAYPRLVAETALNHNAWGVILCHNHPGASSEPSFADKVLTCELNETLARLGVRLMDHIIVGDDGSCSLRRDGIFEPPLQDYGGRLRSLLDARG